MGFTTHQARPVLGPAAHFAKSEEHDPSFFTETIPAAFRLDNTIGSIMSREPPEGDEPINFGFDPFEHIEGYEPEATAFITARNAQDVERIKRQIDRERKDRKTLADAGGWAGFAASFIVGIPDPTNFIPVGGVVARTRNVSKAAIRAGATATAGFASSVAAETALHGTQATRTISESAFNVTGATVFAGVIGAAAPTVIERVGRGARTTQQTIARLRGQIDRDIKSPSMDAPDLLEPGGVRVTADELDDDLARAELQARGSVGAPALNTSTLVEEKLTSALGLERAVGFATPLLRTSASPSVETRRTVQQLAETPFVYEKNALGVATPVAVETRVKTWNAQLAQALDSLDGYFVQYRQGMAGKGKIARARIQIGDRARRRHAGPLSYEAFKSEVDRAMRHGGRHPIPEVAAAAKEIREVLFDPLIDRAIKTGLLPVDVSVSTALSYFTRVHNLEKIRAEEPAFREIITDWLRGIRNRVSDEFDDAETNAAKARERAQDLEGEVVRRTEEHRRIDLEAKALRERRANQEREVQRLQRQVRSSEAAVRQAERRSRRLKSPNEGSKSRPGRNREIGNQRQAVAKRAAAARARAKLAAKNLSEVKTKLRLAEEEAALRSVELQKAERTRAGELSRAAQLRRRMDEKRFFASADDDALAQVAEDIIRAIRGGVGGRISYEAIPLTRGPLKELTLNIPHELIEDFLESDIELIAKMFQRTMAPDVELATTFGRADMRGQIDKINDSYAEIIRRTDNEKERVKLARRRDGDIRDITAMRDRIRGTYMAPDDPEGLIYRSFKFARHLNHARLLGDMVVSTLPRLARPVMVHGLARTFGIGLVPLISNFRQFRAAAKEVKLAGTALDFVMHTRSQSLADIGDHHRGGTKIEQGMDAVASSFGLVSLMAPWTAATKQFVGVMTQTRILLATVNGTDIERLAQSGIDRQMAARIAEQFRRYGDQDEGLAFANTQAWTDRGAVEAFRAAVVKEVDVAILTPGVGDTPLWMSSQTGRLIGQFRMFAFASVQRIAIVGLQRRDVATLNGAVLSVGLGALSYAIKTTSAGNEVSSDPLVWIAEGVDRSRITGWLFDVNNITEKVSGGRVGISAFTERDTMSRYAHQSVGESLLGPTFGLAENVAGAAAATSTGQVREADIRAMRRIVPYQNLLYLRWLFDQAEDAATNRFAQN